MGWVGVGGQESVERRRHPCHMGTMDRADAIAGLNEHEAELKRFRAQHLHLSRSTAREEVSEGSDADFFFGNERRVLGQNVGSDRP
jgi:hypothetical protein